MFQLIDVSRLNPHPDNPRKDLGDLAELADSIKARGVLQNLTVVPRPAGYCTSCRIYNGVVGKCTEGYDEYERPPCSKWESKGLFTVVIGHRRLAAAKLAGLTELPCVISEMSHREQVATMLLENMQRNDLTVYEQAQGFQMMLNLGDSVNDIAGITGFSERTVRRRVKLLELDQDKLKASVARGGTLQDFFELEKIEDKELRNSVLDKIGTANFNYELQRAVGKEKSDKNKAILVAALEQFASQVDKVNNSDMRYVTSYYPSQGSTVDIPEDAGTVEYYFNVSEYGSITLYAKRPIGEAEAAESEAQRQLREKKAELEKISVLAYRLRRDFVKNCYSAKKHMGVLMEFAVRAMLDWRIRITHDEFAGMLGIKTAGSGDVVLEDVAGPLSASPERVLLVATYCALDQKGGRYYSWKCSHEENELLNTVYDFLERLGYEMSDEERALRDGTHELFVKQTAEGDGNEEQAN